MAKRRNLKKEKAQRNLAYARKFRKRNKNTGRFSKNRRMTRSPKDESQEEDSMAMETESDV